MKFRKILAAGIAAVMAVSSINLPTFADIEYFGSSIYSYDAQIGNFLVNLSDSYADYAVTIVGYVGTDTVVNIPKELNTSEYVPGEDPYGKIAKIMDEYDTLKILRVTINAFPATVTAITADTNSENFTAVDGVLYDKDVTMPVSIPGGKSSITLPATVEYMDANNVSYGGSTVHTNDIYTVSTLKEIKVAEGNKIYKSENGVLYTVDGDLVAYPSAKTESEYIIPDTIKSIPPLSYIANPYLKKVTVHSNVEYISPSAFFYSKNLQAIDVDENNPYIASQNGVLFTAHTPSIWDMDDEWWEAHPGCENWENQWILDEKELVKLAIYPCGKEDKEYTVPEGVGLEWSIVEAIARGVSPFYYNDFLETVTFADPYIYLLHCEGTYSNGETETDMLFNNFSNLKTVKGYVGSTIEEYMNYDHFLNIYDYNFYFRNQKQITIDSLPYEFVPITYTVEDTNKTGAEVEGALPYATTLNVEKTDESKTSVTYDITLSDSDGNEVQPTEAVSVKLPVPEGMATEGLKVYRAESDGRYTDMKATYADGFMTFTTDHFSTYIITTEMPSATLFGDADGNGVVDELDSVALARYLANWNVTIDKTAADLDGDGDVGETDSVILARRLAGWNV